MTRSQSAKSTAAPSLRNSPKRIQSAQPTLNFDPEGKAVRNDDFLVRSAISASIRRSEKSRAQIADTMTEMLGARVTEQMLNTYSAGSMSLSRLPAAWVNAFIRAVDDDSLLHAIAEAGGRRVISAEEAELLELGREWLRQKRASENIALLETRLRSVQL